MSKYEFPLTQHQVYNLLHSEVSLRCSFKNMYPEGKSLEECSRIAHIYAVQNTWYWFNNQEELKAKTYFNSISWEAKDVGVVVKQPMDKAENAK